MEMAREEAQRAQAEHAKREEPQEQVLDGVEVELDALEELGDVERASAVSSDEGCWLRLVPCVVRLRRSYRRTQGCGSLGERLRVAAAKSLLVAFSRLQSASLVGTGTPSALSCALSLAGSLMTQLAPSRTFGGVASPCDNLQGVHP